MRALITAVLAAALVTSVSACRFHCGDGWATCDDKGEHCVASSPSPSPAPVVTPSPKASPTAVPTPMPTPLATATPCAAGLILDPSSGQCVVGTVGGGV